MWLREWVRLPTSCDQGLPVVWSKDILCRAGNSQQYWRGCFGGLLGRRPTTSYNVGLFGELNLFTNQLRTFSVVALKIPAAINPMTASFTLRFKAHVHLAKERLSTNAENSHYGVHLSQLPLVWQWTDKNCTDFLYLFLKDFAFDNVSKGPNTFNCSVTAHKTSCTLC